MMIKKLFKNKLLEYNIHLHDSLVIAMTTANGHKVCEYEIPFIDLI